MSTAHIVVLTQDTHVVGRVRQACAPMRVSHVATVWEVCALLASEPATQTICVVDCTHLTDQVLHVEPIHFLAYLRMHLPTVPIVPLSEQHTVLLLAPLLECAPPQHPAIAPAHLAALLLEWLDHAPQGSEASHALGRTLAAHVSVTAPSGAFRSLHVAVLASSFVEQVWLRDQIESTGACVQIATQYFPVFYASCQRGTPDVVVSDLRCYQRMADVGTLPSHPYLVMTPTLAEAYRIAAHDPSMGVLLQCAPTACVSEALVTVANGESYVDPVLDNPPIPAGLSPKEQDLVRLLLRYPFSTSAFLASQCQCAVKTVESHRRSICDKLGVSHVGALCAHLADYSNAHVYNESPVEQSHSVA